MDIVPALHTLAISAGLSLDDQFIVLRDMAAVLNAWVFFSNILMIDLFDIHMKIVLIWMPRYFNDDKSI